MKPLPEDRPALKRFIKTIFCVENDQRDELKAIVEDESLSLNEKAEKYVDTIIDHLTFLPDERPQ